MWMEGRIRDADFVLLVCTETYLRRVERREEPGKGRGVLWEAKTIYNALYMQDDPTQRFIPVLFADGQPSWIPLSLQGLTNYQVDTPEGYEGLYRHVTSQPRYEIPALGQQKALPALAPQSYPASLAAKPAAKAPTSLDQRHRQQLMKQVHLDWIEGVLDQSLYKVARIELGLADRPDFIEQPLNKVVQVPDRAPRVVLPGTPISQIFDEQAGALLILGAPGTGKTTLLLELARDLLARAELDENHPIPAVFNLSSWAVRRQPLHEWLIAELNERSYVSKKVARRWVESEQVLPLLDGLDEVAAEHREACVDAINNFRREYGLLPIAVCSRIADYEALGTKLRLRTAIEVQPLGPSQVDEYLDRVKVPVRGLRTAAADDPSLWELLETPLMLWVAMLAYRDLPQSLASGANLEQRRRQLFAHFVAAMFTRKVSILRYSSDQTTAWLSWLARNLNRNNQAVFYLESLDSNWLSTRAQQRLARSVLSVGFGLGLGLACGLGAWVTEGLILGIVGLIGPLIVGLIGGLIPEVGTELDRIQPAMAELRWTVLWSRRSEALWLNLIFGLIGGSILGLILGLIGGLIFGLRPVLRFGLFTGLFTGLMVGLLILFTSEAAPETRSAANEGTHRAMRMGLIFGLIFGLMFGLMMGGLSPRPGDGLFMGLFGGLLGGMISGGMFAFKHFVLRLFLWRSGAAPLRYVTFLAQAKDLLFLRQVGGGYIFVHRLLRDYFASLSQSNGDKKEKTKAVSADR